MGLSSLFYSACLSPLARRIRREHLTYLNSKKLFQIEGELSRLHEVSIDGALG
jgi:hypothetical protein